MIFIILIICCVLTKQNLKASLAGWCFNNVLKRFNFKYYVAKRLFVFALSFLSLVFGRKLKFFILNETVSQDQFLCFKNH